jgi:hypothetical protein
MGIFVSTTLAKANSLYILWITWERGIILIKCYEIIKYSTKIKHILNIYSHNSFSIRKPTLELMRKPSKTLKPAKPGPYQYLVFKKSWQTTRNYFWGPKRCFFLLGSTQCSPKFGDEANPYGTSSSPTQVLAHPWKRLLSYASSTELKGAFKLGV